MANLPIAYECAAVHLSTGKNRHSVIATRIQRSKECPASSDFQRLSGWPSGDQQVAFFREVVRIPFPSSTGIKRQLIFALSFINSFPAGFLAPKSLPNYSKSNTKMAFCNSCTLIS